MLARNEWLCFKNWRVSSLEDVDMDVDNDLKGALGNGILVITVSTDSVLIFTVGAKEE